LTIVQYTVRVFLLFVLLGDLDFCSSYIALKRGLQRAGYKCRHTQHVTAARSEETILSTKATVGLNVCEEGDLLCTTQDTSFLRSVLGWKHKSPQKTSLSLWNVDSIKNPALTHLDLANIYHRGQIHAY